MHGITQTILFSIVNEVGDSVAGEMRERYSNLGKLAESWLKNRRVER